MVAGQGNGGDKHNGKEVKFHGNLPSTEATGLVADYKVIPHLIYEVSVFKLRPPLKCPSSKTTEKIEKRESNNFGEVTYILLPSCDSFFHSIFFVNSSSISYHMIFLIHFNDTVTVFNVGIYDSTTS